MPHEKEYLTDAHANDLAWKNDLAFYKDDIIMLKKRLEEVSTKNSAKEIKMLVSHFENQLIINKEVIDQLLHDIGQRELQIAAEMKENSIAYEHRLNVRYAELNGKMSMYKKLFAEMKQSLNRFLADNL